MSCQDVNPCNPCNPDYSDTGCPDYPNSGCIIYNGDDIPCLSIVKTESLNDVIDHIKDTLCALTPTAYANFDFSCFSTQGINTEQQFAEFIAETLCTVLGTQTPTTITSLSTLYALIQSLTTNLNLIKNQTIQTCFRGLTGLNNPDDISVLLTAIQTVICDHETRIVALESTSGLAITATDSATVDFTASGTLNHTITADVKRSATANNAITEQADGLHVLSPVITPVDTDEINLTVSGTHSHTIQANINISAEPDNRFQIKGDGAYSQQLPIDAQDSTTINFTNIAIDSFTGSVIVDPDVSNILVATGNGLFVDGSGFALSSNSVTNTILRDSTAFSVIGRTSGSVGDPADIVAAADGVLRRSGSGNLEFGSLVTNNIGNAQVTFSKIQNISSARLLGRTTASSGSIEELTVGSNMNLSGGVLDTFGRTLIGITKFTSDGTWTKPSGCNAALVYTLGAGGGGGGIDVTAAGESSIGGGGGAGALEIHFLTSGLGATETVTVGVGGAAGLASANGSSGTGSSFGTHTGVDGGTGGLYMVSGNTALISRGGGGGNALAHATGIIVYAGGEDGGSGIRISGTVAEYGGRGGSSMFGSSSNTSSPVAPGCGGRGGYDINNGSFGGTSIDGGDGIVIVYEFS